MEKYIDIECPITHDIMCDPVICEDGHIYERAAIMEWLMNNNTSPTTKRVLKSKQLFPVYKLQSYIRDYAKTNGIVIEYTIDNVLQNESLISQCSQATIINFLKQ